MQELQEIKKLTEEFVIENSGLSKELESLVTAQDEIVALLYSRRALEVIITELCLDKLCRQRGTEPLKSIIDRFYKERIVPDFICTSMQNLNSIAAYGAHPKEFDSRQVRTSLIELITILDWYFKEKGYKTIEKSDFTLVIKKTEKKIQPARKPKIKENDKKGTRLILAIIIGIALITVMTILIFNYLKPSDKANVKGFKGNNTITNTDIKANEQLQKASSANDTEKKTDELKKTDLTKQSATLPLQVEKNDNSENTATNKKAINSGAKNDTKIDLGKLLHQVTDKQLSFADRKAASVRMKSLFEKTAGITISIDTLVVDRLSVDDYVSRLLSLPGLQVIINKEEKNAIGKITKLDVTEKK